MDPTPGAAGVRHLPFSVVAKPTGAACNLDCTYCFYLSKELLYDDRAQRMSTDTLEAYLRGFLDAQPDGEVTVAWQGGEPTMRGIDFYREAVRLADELKRPAQRITHTLQTNGTLLNDEWGEFLAEHNFLVGLSIDGPQALHDAYRINRAGRGSHAQVVRGWQVLRRHGVETNILCTVHAANQHSAREIYHYFTDELGARYLQFIPIVERVAPGEAAIAEDGWRGPDGRRILYRQTGHQVTGRSVEPTAWGAFLSEVFDEWIRHDVGTVFVQHVDTMLSAAFGIYSLCIHAPECGGALAVEHNGDVYSCDHFVEPQYLLGNTATGSFQDMLKSPEQQQFGSSKRTTLTAQCRSCPVLWACNGGCPKDRFVTSRDGEPGHDFLCQGYYNYFSHAQEAVLRMRELIETGQAPADIMSDRRFVPAEEPAVGGDQR